MRPAAGTGSLSPTEPHPESARLRRLARSVPVPRYTWPGRRSQPFSSGHQLPFTENRWRRAPSVVNLIPTLYLKGVSSGDFSEALQAILGEADPGRYPSLVDP